MWGGLTGAEIAGYTVCFPMLGLQDVSLWFLLAVLHLSEVKDSTFTLDLVTQAGALIVSS